MMWTAAVALLLIVAVSALPNLPRLVGRFDPARARRGRGFRRGAPAAALAAAGRRVSAWLQRFTYQRLLPT
jgi:hypothetical protein